MKDEKEKKKAPEGTDKNSFWDGARDLAFAALGGYGKNVAFGKQQMQSHELAMKEAKELLNTRELQRIIEQLRLERARQEQSVYESLSPEEKKQKALDPSGYRQLRTQGQGQQEKTRLEQAKELIEMADKLPDYPGAETLSARLSKEAERILFGDAEPGPGDPSPTLKIPGGNTTVVPDAISRADSPVNRGPVQMPATTSPAGTMPIDHPARMPDNRGLFMGSFPGPTSQATVQTPTPVGAGQAAQNAFNAAYMFGYGLPPQRQPGSPGTPAPDLASLGIKTPQMQQFFTEIEKKVPNLRQQFTADLQTYQRLFDALAAGKLTTNEAVAMIQQSMGK